jgi:hypothetical protein
VVKEMEEKLGRKLSNDEISHAVHQSRAKKIKGISTAEVRQRQLSQLSDDERQSLQTLRASAHSTRLPRIALVEIPPSVVRNSRWASLSGTRCSQLGIHAGAQCPK